MKVWFDTEVAAEIGLNESVLLNYFTYWTLANEKSGKFVVDGTAYVKVTFDELGKIFCFWGIMTIKRIVYNLQHEGYIEIRHLGSGLDKTNWYTATAKAKELLDMDSIFKKSRLYQNDTIDVPNGNNGSINMVHTSYQNETSIVSKNENLQYSKKETKRETQRKNTARAKLTPPFDDPPQELLDAWEGFVEMRKSMRKPLTERSIKLITNKLEKLAPGNDLMKADILDQSVERGWQSVFELKVDKPRKADTPYNAQPSAEEMYQEGLEIMKRSGMI